MARFYYLPLLKSPMSVAGIFSTELMLIFYIWCEIWYRNGNWMWSNFRPAHPCDNFSLTPSFVLNFNLSQWNTGEYAERDDFENRKVIDGTCNALHHEPRWKDEGFSEPFVLSFALDFCLSRHEEWFGVTIKLHEIARLQWMD